MYCLNCGKELSDSAKFCGKCGFKVHAERDESQKAETQPKGLSESKQESLTTLLPAASSRRFLNLILDWIFFYCFSFVLGMVLAITGLWVSLGLDNFNETLLSIVLFFLFYMFFEGIWGRTPAKFITGTKVVFSDGSEPNWGSIFIRTILRLIPFEAFSFLGSKNPIGWHDRLSSTAVILSSEAQEKSVVPIKYDKQKNSALIIVPIILISIAVVGVLAAIVLVSLQSAKNKAKAASFRATVFSVNPSAIICATDSALNFTDPGAGRAVCVNTTATNAKYPELSQGVCDGNTYIVDAEDKRGGDGQYRYTISCNIGGTLNKIVCTQDGCN